MIVKITETNIQETKNHVETEMGRIKLSLKVEAYASNEKDLWDVRDQLQILTNQWAKKYTEEEKFVK